MICVSSWYCYYVELASSFALEVVLLVALVGITIFRRQMSCNRCYYDDGTVETTTTVAGAAIPGTATGSAIVAASTVTTTTATPSSTSSLMLDRDESSLHATNAALSKVPMTMKIMLDWDDEHADSVFEGAGSYCSAGSTVLFPFLWNVFAVIPILLINLIYMIYMIVMIVIEVPALAWTWIKSKEISSTEELLDAAGNYFSGRPLFNNCAIVVQSIRQQHLHQRQRRRRLRLRRRPPSSIVICTTQMTQIAQTDGQKTEEECCCKDDWSYTSHPSAPENRDAIFKDDQSHSDCHAEESSFATEENEYEYDDYIDNDEDDHDDEFEEEDAPTVFTTLLPSDTMIHILLFLHPCDIVSGFGCTSRACYSFVNTNQFHQRYCNDEEILPTIHTDPTLDHQLVQNKHLDTQRSLVGCKSSLSSERLWKALFQRDYSWIFDAWDVGRQAKQRSFIHTEIMDPKSNSSQQPPIIWDKISYIRFGLCYMDYVLAGQNTQDCCLVGIGGHIYDITTFLNQHPGSLETVLVHAGRNQTSTFEIVRHTARARRLAQNFCIIVDQSLQVQQQQQVQHKQSSCVNGEKLDVTSSFATNNKGNSINQNSCRHGIGLRPTHHFLSLTAARKNKTSVTDKLCSEKILLKESCHCSSTQLHPTWHMNNIVDPVCPNINTSMSVSFSSLKSVLIEFKKERESALLHATSQYSASALGGDVHVYYDPFQSKWKAWYICTLHLTNQFVDIKF